MSITVTIVGPDAVRRSIESIEGPTAKQARNMAATLAQFRARAAILLAQGNDDAAFNLDCDAMDIEADLVRYGFDPNTGLRARKAR